MAKTHSGSIVSKEKESDEDKWRCEKKYWMTEWLAVVGSVRVWLPDWTSVGILLRLRD